MSFRRTKCNKSCDINFVPSFLVSSARIFFLASTFSCWEYAMRQIGVILKLPMDQISPNPNLLLGKKPKSESKHNYFLQLLSVLVKRNLVEKFSAFKNGTASKFG